MSAVLDALEALGHPGGALPETGLLADLFVRFQAQVPLRSAPRGTAEERLAAWLEGGTGLCGEARTAAFATLAAEAGFALEPRRVKSAAGEARTVLVSEGGRLLLDVSFPLPLPVSLEPPARALATGYGSLSVRPASAGPELLLETRGEVRLLYRVDNDSGSAREPVEQESPEEPGLFRLLEDRLLRWKGGVLEVSDAWSRFRLPFPARDGDGLEALFGPPPPRDDGRVADAQPPTLAVYLASSARPDALRAVLADPETLARTLPEGWAATAVEVRSDGFTWCVREGEELLRTERTRFAPDGLVLEAEGPLALFRTRTIRLEPCPEGTRIRSLGELRDPVPPRGLPEGTRRRLVFELANELLALDRVAAGS
ncbi:MAG: hypothetical protein ACYDBY_11655 [Thermoanaerobaculia bacterium]